MSSIPNSSGAFDFSQLAASHEVAATETQADSDASSMTSTRVPALVMQADAANLSAFLKLSETVPILVELYTLRNAQAGELGSKLAAEVHKRQGRLVLLRIDADANPQLVQAFQAQQLPAVLAILRAQPVPLFSGDQSSESIALVVDKVLEAAEANGVTGSVVPDSSELPAPALPPEHQAAIEAIDRGDYEAAAQAYKSALAQAPADALAQAGLAQVELLKRTEALNYDAVLASDPKDLASTLAKSDALASIGEFGSAFELLLDRFEAQPEERDALRQQLLELFKVAGGDAAVAPARARLTNLLF